MVYLVEANGTNFYKIGFTVDMERRIGTLQSSCPLELLLVNLWEGDIQEYELHQILSKYRVRGEWFDLPEDVLHTLASLDSLENIYEIFGYDNSIKLTLEEIPY